MLKKGGGGGYFAVERSGDLSQPLPVYLDQGGVGTSPYQYVLSTPGDGNVAPGSPITIPAFFDMVTVTMTATDDTNPEPRQDVTLTIEANANYNLGTPNTVTLYIIDNDSGGGPPRGGPPPGSQMISNFGWTWDVLPTPSFSGVSNQTNDEQDSASLSVTATDPGGLSLTYAAINLPPGLAISSSTGLITGTIDYTAAGRPMHDFPVTVLAVNTAGQSDSTSFRWQVENVNRPPTANAVAAQTTQAGGVVDLLLGSTDPDDDRVYLSLDGLPNGLEYNSETGRITGTVRSDEEGGTRTVTIEATDLIDESTQTFSWTINANPHPTLQTVSPQTSTEGDAVSLQVSATDTSGAPLVYSAVDLPEGLAINAQTGLITGTIAPDAAGAGPYLVNVFVDNGLATDLTSFEWTVNPFITMAALPDPTNMEGDSISLQVIGSSPNGPLTFDALDLPDGLEINPATGLISGNVALTTSRHSPYLIRVSATDGTYSTFREAEWSVGRTTNAAPVLPVPPATTATAGEYLVLDLGATDSDEDDIDYTATGLPAGLLIDSTTGLITGTPADSEIPTGSFEVTVTADDGHGGEATRAFDLAVADGAFSVQPYVDPGPLLNNTAVAGREEWIEVATLVDTVPGRSPASYVATIDWGDGTEDDGGYFEIDEFDPDILHIYGRHIYERSGDYEVNVEVVNPAGSIQATATPSIAHVVPDPGIFLGGGLTLQAPAGETFTGTVAVFDTANPFLTVDDITASIAWGNGQTSVGTVVAVDDGFVIRASKAFSLYTAYAVTVTVTADGVVANCGAEVRVGDTYAARLSHLTAGSFVTTEPISSLTATIQWEMGSSSIGQIVPGGGGYQVKGDYFYNDDTAIGGSITVQRADDSIVAYGIFGARAVDSPIGLFAREATPLLGTTPETMGYFADDNPLTSATEYGAGYQGSYGGFGSLTVEQVVPGLYRVQGVPPTPPAQDPRPAIDVLKDNMLVQAKPVPKGKAPVLPAELTFTEVIRANFKALDEDADKAITYKELLTATNDSKFKDGVAACIVMVLSRYNELGQLTKVTFDSKTGGLKVLHLDDFDFMFGLPGPARRALGDIENEFAAAKAQLAPIARRNLLVDYTPADGFHTDRIKQGAAGDCVFVTTMIAVSTYKDTPKGKRYLRIDPVLNPNQTFKSYTVEFGEGANKFVITDVPAPTDAQLLMYGKAGPSGLWFSILERAYVKHYNGEFKFFYRSGPDPYQSFNMRGWIFGWLPPQGDQPAEVIRLLTRNSVQTHMVKRDNTIVADIATKLSKALDRNAVIVGGTRKDYVADAPGMAGLTVPPTGHAYAIIKKADGLLYAINPHRIPGRLYGNEFELTDERIKLYFERFVVEVVPPKKSARDLPQQFQKDGMGELVCGLKVPVEPGGSRL